MGNPLQILTLLMLLILNWPLPAQTGPQGTWIGAYRTDYHDGTSSESQLRFLIEFQPDQITFRSLPYRSSGSPGSLDHHPITRKGDTIVIGSGDVLDTMIITRFQDGELDFYFSDFENNIYTFRKVNSEPVILPDHLTGHTFGLVRNHKKVLDTLEFVNDSLLVFYSQLGTEDPSCRWQLSYFDDHSLLLLDKILIPPYLVDSVDQQVISLSLEYLQTIPLQLKRILREAEKPELDGTWNLSRRIRNGEVEHANAIETTDGLSVAGDVMTIQLDGERKSSKWTSTSTGQYILFPMDGPTNMRHWKLLEISAEKLRVERIVHFAPLKKEILEFLRDK